MRMWLVDTQRMCRQHLLGEHVEMHMFAGSIRAGISLRGYIERGLVIVHRLRERHDALAKEIRRRGWNHKSPLLSPGETQRDLFQFYSGREGSGALEFDVKKSRQDLLRRCPACRSNFKRQGEPK